MTCETCKDWGETLDNLEFGIPCPDCKRLTYPNGGVNFPAGAVVSICNAQAMHYARQQEKNKEILFYSKQYIRSKIVPNTFDSTKINIANKRE